MFPKSLGYHVTVGVKTIELSHCHDSDCQSAYTDHKTQRYWSFIFIVNTSKHIMAYAVSHITYSVYLQPKEMIP